MQLIARRATTYRLVTIILAASTLSLMSGTAAYLIGSSLSTMAETADQIDNQRSIIATKGAIRALKKQLASIVRDNAYWDDAYRALSGTEAASWAKENWGDTTADYPLYDTAAVIQADGHPLIAFNQGKSIPDITTFFDGSLSALIAAARKPDPDRLHLPVAFVRTRHGVAVISAEAIQPSSRNIQADPSKFKVLLFAKHLTGDMLAEIGSNFSIRRLSLVTGLEDPGLNVDLKDITGKDAGHFVWPPERPGTSAYSKVHSTIMAATGILAGMLVSIGAIGVTAIRSIRREERQSSFKATHDGLTGLLNRSGFLEALVKAQEEQRERHIGFHLHLIDLDGFKAVNDAWGHPVGDKLIQAAAKRIRTTLAPDMVAARIGGDEFAVISFDGGRAIATQLRDACSAPFGIDGRTVEIGASIGTASSAADLPGDTLFQRADLALYRAKESGRGVCVAYDESLGEDARNVAILEQAIRDGLKEREFQPLFQPLIDAATGDLSGVEALARWHHPHRGTIRPDVFIPAAERAGLIDVLGMQIMEASIASAVRWPSHTGISINVSPIQLRNPYFAKEVGDLLQRTGFDPTRLTLEVTEGVLIANPEQAKRTLKALKVFGVLVALDDFGCGYASIGALREFGFDGMKIDRSLVVAADTGEEGGAILQATIALANALRIPVTAEGIETERQASIARLCGCDKLQGFLFSKPVSADEIAARYFAQPGLRTAG